jgi:type IV secretion system protein VirB9
MIRKVSFAALAVLGCTSVSAASDNRIRTLAYDPDQIVRILGKAGIQSTVEFGADERIENVAVGDSSAWQITPNRRASLLFVKPLVARSRTNMTVVTDRRTYMFDLVSGERSSTPVYALKFSYPNDKPPELPTKSAQPVMAAAVPAPATMTADKLHFDWTMKGYGKLLPSRVFDDGASLYLAWSRETPLPAILTLSDDSKEGPVNYRMSGEYIVVTPIPQNLVLRYGSKSAALWPSRRIPAPAQANAMAGRMAANPPSQLPPSAPIQSQSAQFAAVAAPAQTFSEPGANPAAQHTANAGSAPIKLANVTSLYSDKLTDADHEQ